MRRRELITLLGGAAANGPSSLKRVCRRHGADAAGDSASRGKFMLSTNRVITI
jgi:hypothetical protein